jgi:hypothetical protein
VWILRTALLRSTTLYPVDHLEHLISKVNWVNFEINSVLPSLLLVFVENVLTCLFTPPPLGNFQDTPPTTALTGDVPSKHLMRLVPSAGRRRQGHPAGDAPARSAGE